MEKPIVCEGCKVPKGWGEELIIENCVSQGYLVNGFPTEKRKLSEEELGEDYFCRERYQLYLGQVVFNLSSQYKFK